MSDADDVLQAAQLRAKRLKRTNDVLGNLAIFLVLMFVAEGIVVLGFYFGQAVGAFPGYDDLERPFTFLWIATAIPMGLLLIFVGPQSLKLEQRQQELVEAQSIASDLREAHPEILAARRLDEILTKIQASEGRARTFWRDTAVNLLFAVVGAVVGIGLTVAAQYIGLIPK